MFAWGCDSVGSDGEHGKARLQPYGAKGRLCLITVFSLVCKPREGGEKSKTWEETLDVRRVFSGV